VARKPRRLIQGWTLACRCYFLAVTGPLPRSQVNVRLDSDEAEVLAAVAFLNDASAAEVLRPIVRDFLRKQRDDPEVDAALKIRKRRQRR
jgi:hypothetical protein